MKNPINLKTDLDRLNTQELGKLFPVFISEPDKRWVRYFKAEKLAIEHFLGQEIVLSVSHIGSTAVTGLPAKPTLDMLLEVDEKAETDKIIAGLKKLDYHCIHRPDNPPPHLMFVKGYTPKGLGKISCHVHVRYKGDWDEIYFRDYLRTHPEIAKEYACLKIKLSEVHRNDREAYTEGKTEFIQRITRLARIKYKKT